MELPPSSSKVKTSVRSKKQQTQSDFSNKIDSQSIGQEGPSGLNNISQQNNLFQQQQPNTLSPYRQILTPFQQNISTPFQQISSPFQQITSSFSQMSTPFQQMSAGLSFQAQTSQQMSGSFVGDNNLTSQGGLNQNGVVCQYLDTSAMAPPLNTSSLNASTSNISLNAPTDSHQYQVPIPINTLNPYHGSYFQNGVFQLPMFQQVVVLVPTIDILKHQNQQQQPQQPIDNNSQTASESPAINAETNTQIPPVELEKSENVDDNQTSTTIFTEPETITTLMKSNIGYATKYQLKLFNHLKSDPPPKNVS